MLPIALVMIIYNTAPFWTSLLGLWINGETISNLEYAAIGVCFMLVIGTAVFGKKQPISLEDI
jgi:drug/metabolite transporter (DMT)-like permease